MSWSPVLVTNLPRNVKDDPVPDGVAVGETDFDGSPVVLEVAGVSDEVNGAGAVVLGLGRSCCAQVNSAWTA